MIGAAGVVFAALCLPSAAPAETPDAISALLAEAQQACAAFEDGVLTIGAKAIQRPDLDADGAPDWVLDTGQLQCSSMASLYCGTGGCTHVFVVGGHSLDRLAKGWGVVDLPPLRVLLLQVHGADCGGTNLRRCVEALTIDADGFQTVRPPRD